MSGQYPPQASQVVLSLGGRKRGLTYKVQARCLGLARMLLNPGGTETAYQPLTLSRQLHSSARPVANCAARASPLVTRSPPLGNRRFPAAFPSLPHRFPAVWLARRLPATCRLTVAQPALRLPDPPSLVPLNQTQARLQDFHVLAFFAPQQLFASACIPSNNVARSSQPQLPSAPYGTVTPHKSPPYWYHAWGPMPPLEDPVDPVFVPTADEIQTSSHRVPKTAALEAHYQPPGFPGHRTNYITLQLFK
ncbi:hypothetical protein C8R43DRAFT_1121036 [Mycena crocata]|nr:hypothetical protein C8R43DRAFT_1121036 [Mycena crocata]